MVELVCKKGQEDELSLRVDLHIADDLLGEVYSLSYD